MKFMYVSKVSGEEHAIHRPSVTIHLPFIGIHFGCFHHWNSVRSTWTFLYYLKCMLMLIFTHLSAAQTMLSKNFFFMFACVFVFPHRPPHPHCFLVLYLQFIYSFSAL